MTPTHANEDIRIWTVEEAMSSGRVTIDGSATIAAGIAKMKELKIDCLVIEPRWHGDAPGLVSARDIALKAVGAGPDRLNFSEHNLAEIMFKPALMVPRGLEVKYAVRLMERSGADAVLVVSEGGVVGTLSLQQVFERI